MYFNFAALLISADFREQNDVFSEVVVGIFMVAVIALLGYFTIVISGVDLIRGRERVRATVEFRDVGGLKERDNVIYRGMKVINPFADQA